ncbi:MAG: transposase [Thermodesulfobacteriota bacterium]|nr:transposase [Thermodesulfobacteriota bacterium]
MQRKGHPQGGAPTEELSLPDVVHRFRSLTTARYRYGVNNDGWQPFPGKLWQRNYYERVIRNENELYQIRKYIHDNPMQWETDDENPANQQMDIDS